jgi:protein AroM
VPPTVAALAGQRQAGILVPLPEQASSEHHKWHALARPPLCAAASPYTSDSLDQVRLAARALKDQGAELIVMDCIGYAWRHRDAARDATDLPVVLSNAVVAKLTATLL